MQLVRRAIPGLVLAIGLGTGTAIAAGAAAPLNAAAAAAAVDVARQALNRGLANWRQKDLRGADRELSAVIAHPGFARLQPSERHTAVYSAGLVALDLEQYGRAHDLLVRSSTMIGATDADWHQRLRAAYASDKDADSVHSLTTIARRWPETLTNVRDGAVFDLARTSGKLPQPAARFDLLDALFEAKWRTQEQQEPSWLWRDLASLLLERKVRDRAIEVSGRVTDPHVLIGMRVDARFAPVVAANAPRFDIERAAAAEIAALRKAVADQPRSLHVPVLLTYSLLGAGEYAQVLAMADDLIARVAAAPAEPMLFEDVDDELIWILDNRARALKGLGRWPEAIDQMERARRMGENGEPNVSQSINLGFMYCELDRPKDARTAIAQVSRVSPYGRMQLEAVRLLAAVELNDAAESDRAMTYLREHQDDSVSTYQFALVHAAQLDPAAQLLVRRLADDELRSDALMEVQDYAAAPAPDRVMKWRATWKDIRARPDVRAAIARVGKVEQFKLQSDSSY